MVDGSSVKVFSRNAAEVSPTFPELAGIATATGQKRLLLDGEIVALDRLGRPSFSRLQQRWPMRRRPARTVAVSPGSGPGAYTGKVTNLLNGSRFAVAKLDVAVGRQFPFAPDTLVPDPVVAIDDDVRPNRPTPMSRVRTYAVASHVASFENCRISWAAS